MRDDWNAVAAAWNAHYDTYVRDLRGLADWCVNAARVRSGMHVLDIAGGSGMPAFDLARRVGPDGRVTSVDLSPDMIRLAGARATGLGIRNLAFAEMDAAALSFPDGTFDAATFSFGLMLCPDPPDVVREMRRVLKAGARYAITVWAKPTLNPFLAIAGRAALEVLELPKPERTDPGPFRLADQEALEATLRDGGLTDFTIEQKEFSIAYESVDAYIELSKSLSPGLGTKLRALPPARASAFDAIVREAVQPYMSDGGLSFPSTVNCVSGSAH